MKRALSMQVVIAGGLLLALAASAQASLTTIGTVDYKGGTYNLIYDNDAPYIVGNENNGTHGIVWLDYTNAQKSWTKQSDWTGTLGAALTYHLNPGITVNWGGDWRLPAKADGMWSTGYDGTTTAGYNIITTELGHLYYTELGNKALYNTNGEIQAGYGLKQTKNFKQLLKGEYWTGTEWAVAYDLNPEVGIRSYHYLNTFAGEEAASGEGSTYYAMAVRDAQLVTASTVPEPSTLLLVSGGLAALVFLRRRR